MLLGHRFYDLCALCGFWSVDHTRRFIYEYVNVWLHDCCGAWESWGCTTLTYHVGWQLIVAPTDRPKSVTLCNQTISWRYYVVVLLYDFMSVLGQIFSLFLCISQIFICAETEIRWHQLKQSIFFYPYFFVRICVWIFKSACCLAGNKGIIQF